MGGLRSPFVFAFTEEVLTGNELDTLVRDESLLFGVSDIVGLAYLGLLVLVSRVSVRVAVDALSCLDGGGELEGLEMDSRILSNFRFVVLNAGDIVKKV